LRHSAGQLARAFAVGGIAAAIALGWPARGAASADDDNQPNAFKSFIQKLNPMKPKTTTTTPNGQLPGPDTGGVGTSGTPAAALPFARPQDSVRKLIAQGTVSGTDLINELKELRLATGDRKARLALAGQVGTTNSALLAAKNQTLADAKGKVIDLFMKALHEQIAAYSFAALTGFMKTLTGDTDALSKETIELPKTAANMTLPQQQSVLTMAALVIAARVTHKGLDAAQADFKNVESEFDKLIDRRQKTATLMADVLDKRRKAKAARDEAEVRHMEADLAQWLSPDDLKFIDSFGEDRPLRDFSNDLGMQNLALQFLRHSDPKAYADFRAETDGLVGRSRAYLRTMTGIAAFGGFAALFTQDVANTTRDKDMGETLTVMPFAFQFAKEAFPLVKLSMETLYTGVVLEPGRFSHNYRVARGTQVTELRHAKNVFEALDGAGEGKLFADALFRSGAPGFIYHVYLCDPGEAGHLIDKAVPGKTRQQFAESYVHASDPGAFLFANALADDPATHSAKLVEPLLSRDQRVRAEAVPLGEVQRQTAEHYSEWDDSQFMRVVLSNSEGSYAQMQVGGSLVRLIPSMTTVYAYESYADSCRHAAAGGTKPAAPAKKRAKSKSGSTT
jgi:hypothetical protein